MMKALEHLIVYLLVASIIGCSAMAPQVSTSKEYAYLAAYVNKNARWGSDEWQSFVTHLNDKHLSELSIYWGVLKETSPGVNVIWGEAKQKFVSVGNAELALNSLGGRDKVVALLQKEINGAAYTIGMFKNGVKWHEIVSWADAKNGVAQTELDQSSFDAERALLNKMFDKNWDSLNPDQRRAVLEKSTLSELSAKDKRAMVAATGVMARGLISTTIALSGFSFYTTMSSVMAASASVVGFTLPIAVYTTASSVAATFTGPLGWSILAAASAGVGLYALAPDEERVTRMVISLHILKAKALNDSM